MRHVLLATALLLTAATAASAQTEPSNRAIQRSENRRALRDARKFKAAEYKDTHLAVTKSDLRAGSPPEAVEPDRRQDSYKFDHTGAAYVKEPIRLGLRPGGKKKKLTTD
jgi:hypothetical protein